MCHTNNKNLGSTEIQDLSYQLQHITPSLQGYWNNKNKIHVTSNFSNKHVQLNEKKCPQSPLLNLIFHIFFI